MAKPALGRDLGSLMGRKPGNAEEVTSARQPQPPGAGVRSLIEGRARSSQKAGIPRWYLFAGDALLVALALITVLIGPHPLSPGREIFCVVTVGLAAVLAVIAILMPERGAPTPSGAGAGVVANGKSPENLGQQKADASGAKQ